MTCAADAPRGVLPRLIPLLLCPALSGGSGSSVVLWAHLFYSTFKRTPRALPALAENMASIPSLTVPFACGAYMLNAHIIACTEKPGYPFFALLAA